MHRFFPAGIVIDSKSVSLGPALSRFNHRYFTDYWNEFEQKTCVFSDYDSPEDL